ncbi:cytochrome bd-I oxidase subunit CydX [Bordetella avium]|uniref:Exported protein n=1 Tax=Bordetella avium (strain 197N) TaxID=360910 RepID=Q2KUE1_BORA1|nr:cytochrome bd-I oxidase subunit CydX [Bordetella avium]AZY50444.1 cytochrome bd-I oxidase subunit CydX [Bordetella avium]AZY53840.1 cytochrome bd-I oxidase subunit CydX [Bordetella avium]RIQ15387.1 cytochrome bd-I oxidase subunit CydX [Bordetella avium]RIQ19807.1 cytochrome bd-I oxidase subunit CydX [Bordetella avium]RIQ34387.1 cytochrome bd-I oxidase subunit CydX [Bordetella avium]
MWYFSWILGLGLACTFAILNAMWFELREGQAHDPLKQPVSK